MTLFDAPGTRTAVHRIDGLHRAETNHRVRAHVGRPPDARVNERVQRLRAVASWLVVLKLELRVQHLECRLAVMAPQFERALGRLLIVTAVDQ